MKSTWPAQPEKHAGSGNLEAGACRVRLADVRDVRSDRQAMGSLGGRVIRETDSAGWVRSALLSMDRDPRIRFVDAAPADDSALVLDVELLKAYIINITMTKSATVVLRVRYGRGGSALDEQIYRGAETGVNWISGSYESQVALDDALAQSIESVDRDVVRHCGLPGSASPELPGRSEPPKNAAAGPG